VRETKYLIVTRLSPDTLGESDSLPVLQHDSLNHRTRGFVLLVSINRSVSVTVEKVSDPNRREDSAPVD